MTDDLQNGLIYTQHTSHFMWTVWDNENCPDLYPLATRTVLVPTIREACEREAEDYVSSHPKLDPDYGASTDPLQFMFDTAFDSLDSKALSYLKAVFTNVQKNWWTAIFNDPQGKHEPYYAYVSPSLYPELDILIRERGAVVGEQATALARTQLMAQGNACLIRKDGVTVCGQPLSCQTMCRFWLQPAEQETKTYRQKYCYFHWFSSEDNKSNKKSKFPKRRTVDEVFECACEEAQLDALKRFKQENNLVAEGDESDV